MQPLFRKFFLLMIILCLLLTTGCSRAQEVPAAETTLPSAQPAEAPAVSAADTPASFLSTITPDGRRCSAEFPPDIQTQYVFTTNQDAHLIWILNQLKPEDFFMGSAENLKVVVTISHPEHPVWLYWDGETTQFSFSFDNTRWAVRSEELNTFLEQLLIYAPENSTYEVYNVAPLNELPETYSQEEAGIDKVVILNEGDVRENAHVWEEFLKSANSRIPTTVRVMKYYSAADGLDPVKNIYDLEFDGNSYYLHYLEKGQLRTVHYHYLQNFTGQSTPLPTAAIQEYALMCLTNEESQALPQNFRENDRFAKPGEDPFMIWCDYNVRQKNLTIPESTKITLEIDLKPIITITDPVIIDSIEIIFSEAEAYFTPKTYFPGPVLRFHSADGMDLSLQLDLEDDLCIFNEQFYRYGKTDASMLQGLWKLLDLSYWPDEVVEHPAFSFYFENVLG